MGGYPEIAKGIAKDHYQHHIESSIATSIPHMTEQQCSMYLVLNSSTRQV